MHRARLIGLLTGAALTVALGTKAAASTLNEQDRAAIEALEKRVVALPRNVGTKEPAPLAQRMAETKVPAVSIAFIESGKVKWARAYGDAAQGRAATPDTAFQTASLSKAVTAAGALRLVDQGRLALDEDVNARLRTWRVPASSFGGGETITLRRLLSHTAGLNVSGYIGYPAGSPLPTVVQSLSGTAPANSPPVRPFAAPGKQIAYSGGGYTVAQLLLSEQEGGNFPRLMLRQVLRPAGMKQSSFDQPLSKSALRRAASGHDLQGAPIRGGGNTYVELAAAGLWTTPSDYGRFLIALQDAWAGKPGALLKPNSAQAMMTPVLSDYGLGVRTLERDGRRVIAHEGVNEGFASRFTAFLDGSRQGVVIMTNGDNGGVLAAGLQRTIARAYGWSDTSAPPVPPAPNE